MNISQNYTEQVASFVLGTRIDDSRGGRGGCEGRHLDCLGVALAGARKMDRASAPRKLASGRAAISSAWKKFKTWRVRRRSLTERRAMRWISITAFTSASPRPRSFRLSSRWRKLSTQAGVTCWKLTWPASKPRRKSPSRYRKKGAAVGTALAPWEPWERRCPARSCSIST